MDTTVKRPLAATVLGLLAGLNAILQLITAVAAVVLWLRPDQVQELFNAPVSDFYWLISAALSGFLFFAYIWLAKGIFNGLDYAWPVVNMLAIINLIFGLFYLLQGTGILMVLISIVVILLNNSRGVRDWYGSV